MSDDLERDRLGRRVNRYTRVGANLGGVAAGMLSRRLTGNKAPNASDAAALAAALGGLKGPIMKIAQLMATIPDVVPPEYAAELAELQSNAPPMGYAFVKRRMAAELGPAWRERFESFGREPAAAASLGQVHRAALPDGREVACKLQYPEMKSAVEADLGQLNLALSVYGRFDKAIDTTEIRKEIAERVREELDYIREAKHLALYGDIFQDSPRVTIPRVIPDLSTGRLLTMEWLEGDKILEHKSKPQAVRNQIATAIFEAWWHPFAHYGVIHGDPHLGNYSVYQNAGTGEYAVNLMDFGCVRIFPPAFVEGVIELYYGLLEDDSDRVVAAYERWGFAGLSSDLIEALNIWARFIYGPLLQDREISIAEGISPAEYGRKQAFQVHQALKEKGPITVPREFVFMDRAAIGLGGAFLHLQARLNFFRLFNEQIEAFSTTQLAARQTTLLLKAGLTDDADAAMDALNLP